MAQSSSRARQRATRRMVFSFAKHSSIGFRSGLYFGRKQSVAPTVSTTARTAGLRCTDIQHDDIAGAQRRCEHLFDVGEEAHAIDRTVEDGGGREAGHAQGGENGRRVPAAVGGVVDHALAPLPTPVAANQVGPHATFIQKHEPRGLAARRDLTRLAPPLLQAVDHATEHARPDVAEARAAWQQTAPTWDPDARLTAYFFAISFDAMPASLSLSTRVRKSREYAAISALLPQEYHNRVLSTSEIRASSDAPPQTAEPVPAELRY